MTEISAVFLALLRIAAVKIILKSVRCILKITLSRFGTNIIPGLRFDYLSDSGGNFSPSLNLSQELGDYFKVKAGVARTFKAPNLYQSSEGYLLYSKGNGCPKDITSGGCYLIGNKDLDPEISVNKEIGLEFTGRLPRKCDLLPQ